MVRGRLGRLVAIVSAFPDVIGLGIDEDCGLLVSPDGIATVMGHAVVCVVDAHAAEPRRPWPARGEASPSAASPCTCSPRATASTSGRGRCAAD